MITKKPRFEKINPAFGSSITIRQYRDPCRNKLPYWHIHPEMELVYVNGGSGKRHIGNQLSYFNNGDLIFIGANLPHYGFTDRLTANRSETILQMREDFLGEAFFDIPEMAPVKKLMERAKRGIAFHGKTKRKAGAKIEKLIDKDPYDRLLKTLAILKQLAISEEYTILNVDGFAVEIEPQDNDRINTVYKYVRENFQSQISLDEISDKVSMTEPAFCRYFKKISGKTFTKFVNEYRLVHASKLLSESTSSITDICFECGFNNFSHFNKQFKVFTGKSPSEYRSELKKIVQA
ncbi:helix-turn-helix domain-containing protein [Fulvivirga sp. 29W222]|uniref:Helix-turn-helix domain-containing protein n=1 Tax=Fulvivirga marina TaxID=2494733 RepID=A0A937FUD7_9BACT|nr:AraC family transcriptional regulator [Fulvivirga marina]MBL6446275.1 helix-turn-helix domain-containing protein [Fulvivirga marina]